MNDRNFDSAAAMTLTRADFEEAARTISQDALRTPLIPYFGNEGGLPIMMKAENLQPLGSFKIRCAANAASRAAEHAEGRIATASMGNFAQGLARACGRRGIALTVHAPDVAARVKIAALTRLGADVVEHPFDEWWRIMTERTTGAEDGVFIHPVCEIDVIAGNGTIGLELIEQMPDVGTVVVPYGGGGLASGIALALRACGHPARIVAVEVETATPFAAARAAGAPLEVVRETSFVDGIGSTRVLEAMWPLVSTLIDDVVVVTLEEVRASLRSAATDNHLVLEGAGAAALAAARRIGGEHVCAILSGGNIDPAILAEQLFAASPV